MNQWLLAILLFFSGYLINIFYITVLYHRGLTHNAIQLRPLTRKFLVMTGNWVTGLDPKGWACMHRLHHAHSDTPRDPHSPAQLGVLGLFLGQLHGYERTLVGLQRNEPAYTSIVRDLEFPVNWLNRKRLWFLPYLLHIALAVLIGGYFQSYLIGFSYWMGIMSHPIQGWMVNALAHSFGYTNFRTTDNSKNNTLVALLVMGEGYQNNHHHMPHSPKFSVQWWELDMGYTLCLLARKLGLVEFNSSLSVQEEYIPRAGSR